MKSLKDEYLERLKVEQKERRIEFAKNFFKFPVAVFVSKTEEIKWYDKYITFLEKDFNE
jgi:hypothetical protein